MARPVRPAPRELTDSWPDQRITQDPAAEAIRLFVLRVRDVAGDSSLRHIASRCGLNHAAVGKVLSGEAWPDARTVALMEMGLEARLWPHVTDTGHAKVAPAPDPDAGTGPEQG